MGVTEFVSVQFYRRLALLSISKFLLRRKLQIPESKATDDKTADNTNKFSDTQNTKESSPKDAEEEDDDDDLEEDFYEQQEKSRSKDEHPFREFFSNFRSKRKIEMNRDEQILSRISDEHGTSGLPAVSAFLQVVRLHLHSACIQPSRCLAYNRKNCSYPLHVWRQLH